MNPLNRYENQIKLLEVLDINFSKKILGIHTFPKISLIRLLSLIRLILGHVHVP